jgi:predicted AlkP superfamily phosphohydrolase/phosphomutase
MRSILIGLDGTSWNVLDVLLDTGELPNLQRLRDAGASGVLESSVPFFNTPAWVSVTTGGNPANHGIYDALVLREDGRLTVAHQRDLRRPPYYDQLGREGRRTILLNLPIDQDGCDGAVIVNGFMTDDDQRRILPVGRAERYRRLLDAYRTFPLNPRDVVQLRELEQARFDLARELFLGETWDHFCCLFSSPDLLGHALTGLLLRGDEGALASALELYRDIDTFIGWFCEHAPDALLMVVSPYGQSEERAVLRINTILDSLDLLTFAVPPEPVPSARGLRPRRFRRSALPAAGLVSRPMIDRRASRAFCPTDSSFAVHVRGRDDGVVEEVREALESVKLRDGSPAIAGVWSAEELYGRLGEPGDPTLLFAPADGVRPSTAVRTPVIEPVAHGGGCHQRDGLLLVAGPNVIPGDLGRPSVYDIAPTLLWAMGAGIPVDGDGQVLAEAFTPEFATRQPYREVACGEGRTSLLPTGEGAAELERRLKALGYI